MNLVCIFWEEFFWVNNILPSGFFPSMEVFKFALRVISCRLFFTVVSPVHFRDSSEREQATTSLVASVMPGHRHKYGNWTVYRCWLWFWLRPASALANSCMQGSGVQTGQVIFPACDLSASTFFQRLKCTFLVGHKSRHPSVSHYSYSLFLSETQTPGRGFFRPFQAWELDTDLPAIYYYQQYVISRYALKRLHSINCALKPQLSIFCSYTHVF